MDAIFEREPWDPRFPLYYPYIVIEEEDGEERIVGLTEAIQNALETLLLVNSRANLRRYIEVIEFRFGLKDGVPRTLRQVAQELGMRSREQVRQMELKVLRMLRHPSRSRRLHEFLMPSPEEMGRKNRELQDLRNALHLVEEKIDRLAAILKGSGLREKDFEEVALKDIPQTAQALQKDRVALQILIAKLPNKRVWNPIARARINQLSTLRELVESGEIRRVRQIGPKHKEFLDQALQTVKQEASS